MLSVHVFAKNDAYVVISVAGQLYRQDLFLPIRHNRSFALRI